MPAVTISGSNLDSIGKSVATHKHAAYTLFEDEWRQLADVREGTGGFMTGEYLVAHPREWKDHDSDTPSTPTKKLTARRNLARYENLAAAILEAKGSSLFRTPASRQVGESNEGEIVDWWEDVDGQGTHIVQAMARWWDLAATFGHIGLFFDLPHGAEDAQTAADIGMPVVRTYSPLDILDWLVDDDGELVAVKLAEAVPAESFSDIKATRKHRIRIIDRDEWILTDAKGNIVERGTHGLGRLPFVYLYGSGARSCDTSARASLDSPSNYIDLFNLVSEGRELIRNQTFSMINIPLGTGDGSLSVQEAQTMLGQQSGTMNVLFSALPAGILSGDAANVETVQKEIMGLKRDIYRVTGVPWESDSRDAESGDSMRIRREELNTRLAGYGNECEHAERELVDLFYRLKFGSEIGTERAEEVTIRYPDRFDPTPFEGLIQQIEAAQAIDMPDAFMKELRKAIVSKFEGMGDLTETTLKAILDEIDAAETPDPAEEMKQRVELQRAAIEGRNAAEPVDDADD